MKPKIYINGEERYKTFLGALLSVVSLFAIVGLSIYLVFQMLLPENTSIVLNQKSGNYTFFDFSKTPIVYATYNSLGSPLNDLTISTTIMSVKGVQIGYANGTPTFLSTYKIIPVENCNLTKHFKGENFDLYKNIPYLSAFLCPNLTGLNISGSIDTLSNPFFYFNIGVIKCQNNTIPGVVCKTQSIIDSYLSSGFIALMMNNYQIDHNNKTTPVTPSVKTSTFVIGTSLYRSYARNLKSVLYNTDYGILFKDITSVEKYQVDDDITTIDVKPPATQPGIVGDISFYMNGKVDIYSRSFIKLQNLMANITGIMRGVTIITSLIVRFLSSKFYFYYFVKKFISFENSTHAELEKSRSIDNINNIKKLIMPISSSKNTLKINSNKQNAEVSYLTNSKFIK